MEKKYELLESDIKIDGKKLFRIRALRHFKEVGTGELGGYVQSEKNLSHDGRYPQWCVASSL